MTKILLPIDGSDRSARTVAMLKQIFPPETVEVTLLTVVSQEAAGEMTGDSGKRFPEEQARLDEIAGELSQYALNTKILAGSPGAEIVRYAERHGIDVIMLTRSSQGPRVKMGSVATYIVRKAPYIDLIIMHEQHEPMHA